MNDLLVKNEENYSEDEDDYKRDHIFCMIRGLVMIPST